MKKVKIDGRLKAARIEEGLTQYDLAGILGVSMNSVCMWEAGKGSPTRANKAKIELWLKGELDGAEIPKATKEQEVFAKRILRLRVSYGMTQRELAEELGMSAATIGSWESGKTKASRMHHEAVNIWEENNKKEEY